MLVFVSGPYSADTAEAIQRNVDRAMQAGLDLYRLGHIPFIPHLSHWLDAYQRRVGFGLQYEDYMAMDRAMLHRCDSVLYLGASPGADREVEEAEAIGKHVYRSLAEMPKGDYAHCYRRDYHIHWDL